MAAAATTPAPLPPAGQTCIKFNQSDPFHIGDRYLYYYNRNFTLFETFLDMAASLSIF